MNCLKCKKFDSKTKACNGNTVKGVNSECYLKLIHSILRASLSEQHKLTEIFLNMLELQIETSNKYGKWLDSEMKDVDNGDEWKKGI